MRPVLFSLFGLPVHSYGVSKALAALFAAWLLAQSFSRRGLMREDAYALTTAGTLWGFAGAKVYYVAEHARDLTWHHLGGSGFTWYGGLLAGGTAVVVTARRRHLPLPQVMGLAAAPLAAAYGIGRLGCWFAGDGTYGKPSSLPWAMAFPDGEVPTLVRVQPTPLYEALAAFALAAVLWRLQRHWQPLLVVATYLIASGGTRFLVEIVRTNRAVVLGLSQPQLWSIALVVAGGSMFLLARRQHSSDAAGLGVRAGSQVP